MLQSPLTSDSIDGTLGDETHTRRLAAALSAVLRAGDILLLDGPVGAGKSFFARALIQAAQAAAGDAVEDVPSPSYTLLQTYGAGGRSFLHADLYRLGSTDELAELGLDAAFEDHTCLIEWPERLGSITPRRALELRFSTFLSSDEARSLSITPNGAGWSAALRVAQDVLR